MNDNVQAFAGMVALVAALLAIVFILRLVWRIDKFVKARTEHFEAETAYTSMRMRALEQQMNRRS